MSYLSRRFPHSAEAAWAGRVEAGLVTIDGAPARPDDVVRGGQTVVWTRPGWVEPAAPLSWAVLYRDDDVLAAAKPAGLPTLPGGGFLDSTLLHRVRAAFPDAAPLHRLGRWTSGIVLFARSRVARVELSRQWAEREVGKRYRALARGAPARPEFRVTTAIGPVPHAALGTVHAASPRGKESESRVVVVEQREEEFLCDVWIATGRPHQIRIHLAAAGHPLVGDPLYPAGGVPAPDCTALPGDPGYHLHAAELTFRHPTQPRTVEIQCPPPSKLERGEGGTFPKPRVRGQE